MKKKISDQQIAFIEFELRTGDAKAKKAALQLLSSLYRKGGTIGFNHLEDVERQIVSLLLIVGQDKKVVRWGLNALAQCGRWQTCQNYIESALSLYAGDPEIEAAGTAALCSMLHKNTDEIEALQRIDPKIWKLAALQTSGPKRIDLSGIQIDIGRDDKEILKLALITIGVNKDIEHLFHPKHSNGTFVRELCQHDDRIVQQYSVWAVTENVRLNLQHLGLKFDEIERLPENVQSKMYQLVAQRFPDLRRRLDLISEGSYSNSLEAREGLAKGVRHSYFEGLETAVIPWFGQETSSVIRGALAEHMAAYSGECGPYSDVIRQAYDESENLRSRILLGAEGTSLYGELKTQEEPNLLSLLGHADLPAMVKAAQRQRSVPKKTVCMLLVSPRGEPALRLDEEVRDTLQKLKAVEQPAVDIEIRTEWAVKRKEFTDHLLNVKPQIC
jgi:hypothetical protein